MTRRRHRRNRSARSKGICSCSFLHCGGPGDSGPPQACWGAVRKTASCEPARRSRRGGHARTANSALRILVVADHLGPDRRLVDRALAKSCSTARMFTGSNRARRRAGARSSSAAPRTGRVRDVTPPMPGDGPAFNVRTRVHEYGGGAYLVSAGTVYFCNDADQRLYRQEGGARAGSDHPRSRPAARAALRRRGDGCRPRPDDLGARGPHDRRARAGQHARRDPARRRRGRSASCNRAATSMPRRASAPMAAGSPGSNGTIRTCRGSAANCGSASSPKTARSAASGGSPAVTTSRSFSPNGRPTARSILFPTAPSRGSTAAGGICSGGCARRGSRSSRSGRWPPSSAGRSGTSACRPSPSTRRRTGSSAAISRTASIDWASIDLGFAGGPPDCDALSGHLLGSCRRRTASISAAARRADRRPSSNSTSPPARTHDIAALDDPGYRRLSRLSVGAGAGNLRYR